MPNLTLAIDEQLLKKSREYAKKHKLSLNALIRQLLEERVLENREQRLAAGFALMDQVSVSSEGSGWTREELHER